MEPAPLSLPGSSLSHSVSGWPCRSFLLSSCCRCWVCVVAPGCLGYCFLPLEGGRPVAPLPTLSLPCALAPLAFWVHCAVQLCAMATAAPPWAKALCCSLAVEAACLLARAAKQPRSVFVSKRCFGACRVRSVTSLQLVCTKVLQARKVKE